jgi:sugar/nucleoside kinase (ribokinase family)
MSQAYSYGMISPSTVHVLRSDFAYPKPNTYAEIARSYASIGGEAANSAIVLAKLGLLSKLDGNWIHPARAAKVTGLLRPLGVDVSRLTVSEAGGTEEVVIADRDSRTVFGNYASFHAGPRQWNEPAPDDIREAGIVCLDPYFKEQSLQAARLCVELRTPYVTLDCPYDGEIARHAAALVVSHELREQTYPARDVRELFAEFQERCQGLVIFTFGSEELWYARRGGERKTREPYAIEPLDTTGAGDSFRAGVAYGILQRWDDERIVELASAVAACVCLTVPHTLNAPGLDAILSFMAAHRSSPANS